MFDFKKAERSVKLASEKAELHEDAYFCYNAGSGSDDLGFTLFQGGQHLWKGNIKLEKFAIKSESEIADFIVSSWKSDTNQ